MNNVFEYYEYYTLKLKTLAPVFIGSGKSVGKKEFCYIPETNRIVFMDMKKIIDYIFENKPKYQYSKSDKMNIISSYKVL